MVVVRWSETDERCWQKGEERTLRREAREGKYYCLKNNICAREKSEVESERRKEERIKSSYSEERERIG